VALNSIAMRSREASSIPPGLLLHMRYYSALAHGGSFALRLLFGRFILDNVPMLRKESVLDAEIPF
jgi:hypothetical protein